MAFMHWCKRPSSAKQIQRVKNIYTETCTSFASAKLPLMQLVLSKLDIINN